MSKITNIYTGEKLMTQGNALRHYIAKGEKALKSQNYDKMKQIWVESSKILDTQLCFQCPMEDFGYCGLRHQSIDETFKFMEYCFPSLIKLWKEQLQNM